MEDSRDAISVGEPDASVALAGEGIVATVVIVVHDVSEQTVMQIDDCPGIVVPG
jgi:hypothetical protein